ncbi:MAG: sensor histidine kinase [Acidisphaera sp.]|nr:sensor histidine kinase [Acidisphaera sp.]
MAVLISWQNYRIAAAGAVENVTLIRQSVQARHDAALEAVVQMLGALSKVPSLRSPASCENVLGEVLSLNAAYYTGLFVVDADGQVRCSASTVSGGPARGADLSGASWFAEVARSRDFVVRAGSAGSGTLLQAAYPLLDGNRLSGAMVAGLRPNWLIAEPRRGGPSGDLWLLDREVARPVDLSGAPAGALPPSPILRRLLAQGGVLETVSRDGQPFSYAIADLGHGLHLLVGYGSARERARARGLLLRRIAELGVLLLSGLAAIAFGANLAVVEPIKRLNHAVGRWRGGGRFDPGDLAGVPQEVRELSLSFAQATEALTEREMQLRGSLAEQDLLMQEIHHRVKNNLQIIASLLNLQAARIRQPEARAEFQSARDRIRALGTLHRHLYAHGELHTLNMRSFMKELCDQLFQALGETPGARIRLDIEAPELQLSSDQAVPLALIVTETVSNAVKYAFPAGRGGAISVRLTVEGEEARLVIRDDGVGIPSGRSEMEPGARDGIGIQLVRGFARQLGASLTVTEGAGTRYEIEMKLRPQRPSGEVSPAAPVPSRADA